jgi:hypothetical protein
MDDLALLGPDLPPRRNLTLADFGRTVWDFLNTPYRTPDENRSPAVRRQGWASQTKARRSAQFSPAHRNPKLHTDPRLTKGTASRAVAAVMSSSALR